jgi:hypothetical protein
MFRSAKFLSSSFAAAAAILLAAAAPASAHYTNSGSKYCGFIVFQENTDSGASGIEAKRTTCRTARRLAKAVNRGNTRPLGYRCTLRSHDDERFIAHSDVKCKKGRAVVTWIAT